eukprot:6114801-Amphidinium_carterae.2
MISAGITSCMQCIQAVATTCIWSPLARLKRLACSMGGFLASAAPRLRYLLCCMCEPFACPKPPSQAPRKAQNRPSCHIGESKFRKLNRGRPKRCITWELFQRSRLPCALNS